MHLAVLAAASCTALAAPQSNGTQPSTLENKVDTLDSELSRTKEELSRSREEIEEFRRELEAIKAQLPGAQPVAAKEAKDNSGMYPTLANVQSATPTAAATTDQEQQDELAARVNEQAQTKVESASR